MGYVGSPDRIHRFGKLALRDGSLSSFPTQHSTSSRTHQVDQARLYVDVDGPLTGPRRRQLRRFLATVRRLHLSGSVAFTTTTPDDRAFLATLAGTYGFTYVEAAAHTTLSADWTTSKQPEPAG
jgi:hypothetical protein